MLSIVQKGPASSGLGPNRACRRNRAPNRAGASGARGHEQKTVGPAWSFRRKTGATCTAPRPNAKISPGASLLLAQIMNRCLLGASNAEICTVPRPNANLTKTAHFLQPTGATPIVGSRLNPTLLGGFSVSNIIGKRNQCFIKKIICTMTLNEFILAYINFAYVANRKNKAFLAFISNKE